MTSDNQRYNATERGVRDAWDFWLSQHDVSVPETIQAAIESVMRTWLVCNADDLFTEAVARVAERRMPVGDDMNSMARLAQVRRLVDRWTTEDGTEATHVLERLRSLLDEPSPGTE